MPSPDRARPVTDRARFGALRTLPPFVGMLWRTSRALTTGSLVLRLVRAGLPIATLFVAKLIIDEVVRLGTHPASQAPWVDVLESRLGLLLLAELGLALLADALGRAVTLVDSLLSEPVQRRDQPAADGARGNSRPGGFRG